MASARALSRAHGPVLSRGDARAPRARRARCAGMFGGVFGGGTSLPPAVPVPLNSAGARAQWSMADEGCGVPLAGGTLREITVRARARERES